jgi:K+-transporting ATPase ATPase C chain
MSSILRDFLVSIRLLVVMTVLLGILYPFLTYGIGMVCFPEQAQGSLIKKGDVIVGSTLLAQKWTKPGFFKSRPSAGDYQTIPSGASNLSATSSALSDAVETRLTENPGLTGREVGAVDLLTASGSGLDPDLSPDAVKLQIDRVVTERHLSAIGKEKIVHLIDDMTKERTLGVFGMPRVNILELNLALESME